MISSRLPAIHSFFGAGCPGERRHRRDEVGELIKKKKKKKTKKKLRAWMTSGALRERVPSADREKAIGSS